MEFKSDKRKKKNKKQEALVKRPTIIIPYVEKVLAAIVTIMKKHNVPVAMNLGRHCMMEDIRECVYKVPCANGDQTYVGESGRNLG